MLRNITWTVSARYIAQGLAVVSNILLARYLGADGFGEYALASSVLLIGNAFTNFGMDMILIRKIASENDSSLLADGLWLQLFLSVLYIAGVFSFGLFISIPASVKIYMLTLLPLSLYSIFTIKVRAYQQMEVFSVAQVLTAGSQLLAVFVLWVLRGDVKALVIILFIAQILIASWVFTNHASRFTSWHFSPSKSFALLKDSAHMAVIGTLRLVYEKITITLLPALAGLSMTGVFSAALRVMDAGKLGHLSAFTAIYPEMARDGDFGKQLKGLRPLLGAALLISVFLFFFAEPIMRFLFGVEFLPAVLPLKVLAWIVAPYVLVTYTSLGLVALGFEKPILMSLLVALAALLILLVTLTPQFGLTGSAAAILTAELLHATLLWRQWRMHVLSKLP